MVVVGCVERTNDDRGALHAPYLSKEVEHEQG